jgi:AbrB family looped-hinge helix DNA binding protein
MTSALELDAVGAPMGVILVGMTHRVGPKGQVVIPKELRDELGIEPGDEVSFWRHGDHVAVRPTARRRPLRGRFRGSPLVDELAAERAADSAREECR